jgi:hypothetical protein
MRLKVSTDRAGGLMPAGRSGVHRIAGRSVFIEVLPAPLHLIVCGAGDDWLEGALDHVDAGNSSNFRKSEA